MENYNLEKLIWTQSDFDVMGWHDSIIWGTLPNPERYEYLFDLDYIFKWIKPKENEKYFRFIVAPVTMVFENAYNIKIDIESDNGEIEVADLYMDSSRNTKIGNLIEYTFRFVCHQGVITLTATGFKMYVRQKPKLLNGQSFDFIERGGISFERKFKDI